MQIKLIAVIVICVMTLQAKAQLRVQLKSTLDSKKLKVGDAVAAVTLTDVTIGNNAFPRGSVVTGHVSELTLRDKQTTDGSLGLVFDQIQAKSETRMKLKIKISSVARSRILTSQGDGMGAEVQSVGPGPTAEPRASVAGVEDGIARSARGAEAKAKNSAATEPGAGVSTVPDVRLKMNDASNSGTFTSFGNNVKLLSGTEMVLTLSVQ